MHDDAFPTNDVVSGEFGKVQGFRAFGSSLDPDIADSFFHGLQYHTCCIFRVGEKDEPVNVLGERRDVPVAVFVINTIGVRVDGKEAWEGFFAKRFKRQKAEFKRASRDPRYGNGALGEEAPDLCTCVHMLIV